MPSFLSAEPENRLQSEPRRVIASRRFGRIGRILRIGFADADTMKPIARVLVTGTLWLGTQCFISPQPSPLPNSIPPPRWGVIELDCDHAYS